MRLTVVGCSGSYPGPDSPASCYLVEAEEPVAPGLPDRSGLPGPAGPAGGHGEGARVWRVLIDLGNGALGQLHRFVDPLSIDAVLISHHHPDHYGDMCGYYVMRKYHPTGPQPRIPVWGPAATAERMALAYDLPVEPGMREEFDFREYDGAFQLGPFWVEPIRVDHPVEAFGLRITADGSTLAYSGDTASCQGLDRVADAAAFFLAEASFRERDENPPHVHLTGRDAGATASRAGARRLVLTHIPPWFERDGMLAEARTAYDGPIDLAIPGAVYDV